MFKMYKKLLQPNSTKTTQCLKKMDKGLEQRFSKEDMPMTKGTWKGDQHHWSSGKRKRIPEGDITSGLLATRLSWIASAGEGRQKRGPSQTVGENVNRCHRCVQAPRGLFILQQLLSVWCCEMSFRLRRVVSGPGLGEPQPHTVPPPCIVLPVPLD